MQAKSEESELNIYTTKEGFRLNFQGKFRGGGRGGGRTRFKTYVPYAKVKKTYYYFYTFYRV